MSEQTARLLRDAAAWVVVGVIAVIVINALVDIVGETLDNNAQRISYSNCDTRNSVTTCDILWIR